MNTIGLFVHFSPFKIHSTMRDESRYLLAIQNGAHRVDYELVPSMGSTRMHIIRDGKLFLHIFHGVN